MDKVKEETQRLGSSGANRGIKTCSVYSGYLPSEQAVRMSCTFLCPLQNTSPSLENSALFVFMPPLTLNFETFNRCFYQVKRNI